MQRFSTRSIILILLALLTAASAGSEEVRKGPEQSPGSLKAKEFFESIEEGNGEAVRSMKLCWAQGLETGTTPAHPPPKMQPSLATAHMRSLRPQGWLNDGRASCMSIGGDSGGGCRWILAPHGPRRARSR